MFKDISPIELKEKMISSSNDLTLLDVRELKEFEITHIENSLLIPMSELTSRLDEIDKTKTTVVICHHGIRSRSACILLQQNGIVNLFNLYGGINAWAKEVDSTIPIYV